MSIQSNERLGSYQLGIRLGRGASGVVRMATSDAHPEPVAIKILREDLADDERTVARFVRERKITGGVDHPNVVKVHDLVAEDDRLGIVMELIEGDDLKGLVASGDLSPTDSVEIARQVAAGLAHLHEVGVFHRDLKPANVMVSGPPGYRTAKITDFGVAWLVNETMTRLTTTVGTPLYMAPEVTGARGVGPESDVYALGVVLYEMLTGGAPYRGDNPMGIVMAHIHRPTPMMDGVPPELSILVAELMSKEPADRPTAARTATSLAELGPLVDDEVVISASSPLIEAESSAQSPVRSRPEPSESPLLVVVNGEDPEPDTPPPTLLTPPRMVDARPSVWASTLEFFDFGRFVALGTVLALAAVGGVLIFGSGDGAETLAAAPEVLPATDERSAEADSPATEPSGPTVVQPADDPVVDGESAAARGILASDTDTDGVAADPVDGDRPVTGVDDASRESVAAATNPPVPPAIRPRPETTPGSVATSTTLPERSTTSSSPISITASNPSSTQPTTEVAPNPVTSDDVTGSSPTSTVPTMSTTVSPTTRPTTSTTRPATTTRRITTTATTTRRITTTATSTRRITTTATTTRRITTTRPTTTLRPATTTRRITTTRPTTTLRPATTTTRPTTTLRPATTTTRPATTLRPTTTVATRGEQIRIVSAPRVVSVSSTSAVFAYSTNDVCGTGSFTYRKQSTGEVVGRWIGDNGCFGPRHEGRTSWPGITLEPGTTYSVSITVEGKPGDGVLPTGIGRVDSSIVITTPA